LKYKNLPDKIEGRVRVYWNTHLQCWSVMQKGKVIGHTSYVTLSNVVPIISLAGQARVRREKRKDVHAYLEGDIVPNSYISPNCRLEINYDPYKDDNFKLHLKRSNGELLTVALDSSLETSNLGIIDRVVLDSHRVSYLSTISRRPHVLAKANTSKLILALREQGVHYMDLLDEFIHG